MAPISPTPLPWTDEFAGLARLPDTVRAVLHRDGRHFQVKAGARVFGAGTRPQTLLFLQSGRMRVSQTSDSGREIVLYRVEAGQSCVMTTACVLAHEAYLAEGHAETDLRAVGLAMTTFDRLMGEAPAFRDFILSAYTQRMSELFRVIDDVAFGRIDVRLAKRVLELAGGSDTVAITHQKLAAELGTAREVISRQLTEFQRRGFLNQERGKLILQDIAGLHAVAES